MRIQSFHASLSEACGISIFSDHLKKCLSTFDVDLSENNIRTMIDKPIIESLILHYIPSSFIDDRVSRGLIDLLDEQPPRLPICIIMHGIHEYGETRFNLDGICFRQEEHARLILEKATFIVVLSDGVAVACRSWCRHFGVEPVIVRINHPGLYVMPTFSRSESFAFLGGISRPKKNYQSFELRDLVGRFEETGLRVWQHWTNVNNVPSTPPSWRRTSGVVSDEAWSSMIGASRVVLCPYNTRIQAVSGIISEAVSAGRFVLATSFEASREMQRLAPNHVRLEDDLRLWPEMAQMLPIFSASSIDVVPTWPDFARCIASQFDEILGRSYSHSKNRAPEHLEG